MEVVVVVVAEAGEEPREERCEEEPPGGLACALLAALAEEAAVAVAAAVELDVVSGGGWSRTGCLHRGHAKSCFAVPPWATSRIRSSKHSSQPAWEQCSRHSLWPSSKLSRQI